MTTKDHNETLAGIHLAVGAFLALVLLVAPWMVARDLVRHKDQIPVAVIIFVIVLAVTLFMVSTAIAMHKKKPLGRELALWAAPLLFMIAGLLPSIAGGSYTATAPRRCMELRKSSASSRGQMSDIDEAKTIAAACSIDAVAELMSVHRSTVERVLESRMLGFYKIGRRRVIGQAHLNQYLAQVEREPITESHRR